MPAALSTDSGAYILSEPEAACFYDAEVAIQTANPPATTLTTAAHRVGRYFTDTLEIAATVVVSLLLAPLICIAWLAVWVHQRNLRGAGNDTEKKSSLSAQAWKNEMRDFDRF